MYDTKRIKAMISEETSPNLNSQKSMSDSNEHIWKQQKNQLSKNLFCRGKHVTPLGLQKIIIIKV